MTTGRKQKPETGGVPAAGPVPWREQAVARSLDPARLRAEHRVQRYLDAARELIDEKGGLDFTVQEVVERSQQSLRSFYQSFDGKQHLLLAVYEEAIAATAVNLQAVVGDGGDVVDRLHRFVVTLYEWCVRDPEEEPPAPHRTVRAMAEFVFDQLRTDPASAAAATAPLFEPLVALIGEGQRAGALRDGNPRRLAAIVMQTTMFCAFGASITGGPEAQRARAEEMWAFCAHGLAPAQPAAPAPSRRRSRTT